MIGDPGGKPDERDLLTAEELAANLEGIRPQLGRFLDFSPRPARRALLLDNARLARAPRTYRLPARRGQALHGQPDGGQGVGAGPLRAPRAGHLLHRVQLHAAAGLRLPPAPPATTAASCRSAAATSGATSPRGSTRSAGAPGRGVRADHAARRRRPTAPSSARPRAAPSGSTPQRTSPYACTSTSSAPRTRGRRLPALLHLPRPRGDRALDARDGRAPRAPGGAAGAGPRRSSRWCTARGA